MLAPAAHVAQAQTPVAQNTDISGTIDVGMVANPQMVALQELVQAGEFNKIYPNIKVNLTVLPENEIRQTITQDVTTQSGQFDVFTIGPFEVPMWAEQGWLEEVGKEAAADPSYNLDDIFASMKAGLSYDGGLYALPFYGESAMTFYRKDLFDAAGIQMPERPTWDQIRSLRQSSTNLAKWQVSACAVSPDGARWVRRWAPSSMRSVAAGTTKTGSPSSTIQIPLPPSVSTSRPCKNTDPRV